MWKHLTIAVWLAGCGKESGAPSGGSAGSAMPAGEAVLRELEASKVSLAKVTVRKVALELYPMWAVRNVDAQCPSSLDVMLATLGENEKLAIDPWGTKLELACGAEAPAAAKGIAVSSAGPDKQHDTSDDVRSWQ